MIRMGVYVELTTKLCCKSVPLFYPAFHNKLMQYAHISATHALLDLSKTCAAICLMYTLQIQQSSGKNTYLKYIAKLKFHNS